MVETNPLEPAYSAAPAPAEDPVQHVFVPDYQGTAIWVSLGAMATEVALRVDPEGGRRWLRGHLDVLERDGTAWEVLFYINPPRRHTVRLGRVSSRIAQTAKTRIESLVAAITRFQPAL